MLRILYNSRNPQYKEPFGTLKPGEVCTLRVKIPVSCQTRVVTCQIEREDGQPFRQVPLTLLETVSPYETWGGQFALDEPGLYFYSFRITTANESFALLKLGEDTNMEAGEKWQLSCITPQATVPQWAKGAVMYQIFPDRFAKSGVCDLTGKLEPYTIHQNWEEEVHWQPTMKGEILNNDFFGGNFWGIQEKLPYLASLGVGIVYLNPIGKAFSSHRYDTGDYKTPDPMLGTEEDFAALCRRAHELGIRVILDGVYSHTGSDSLYFNRSGSFGDGGAYRDAQSPYRSWYCFRQWPDKYLCWWDFDTLPCLDKNAPEVIDYLIDSEDSVVAHWLALGADGFRLDVVDELPDSFVLRLKNRIRQLKPDALLIGEVWEDASNKIAYDVRRRYFVDGELDSVMNYPFRRAIIDFVRHWDDGSALKDTVMTIAENYPADVLSCSMSILGTHDTPRILTAVMDDFEGSRAQCVNRQLSPSQLAIGKERLMIASFLQFMLPGVPCIYYGDEAGMEGFKDPFNRRTYPWGKEDRELRAHYTRLGKLRQAYAALREGDVEFFRADEGRLGISRRLRDGSGKKLEIYVNYNDAPWEIPCGKLLYGYAMKTVAEDALALLPHGFSVIEV